MQVHAFEVHARFGDLRSPSKLARLQLAALYAATSTLLPEPLSRKTGAHMALQLLRQCWGNSPLTPEEGQQLDSVGWLGGHLAAGLRLLVHEFHLSATQLAHLHVGGSGAVTGVPALDPDAGTCYSEEALAGSFQGWSVNPHMLLSDEEELRATDGATRSRGPAAPPWFQSGSCRTQSIPPCQLAPASAWVEAIERDISRCVSVPTAGGTVPPYPLKLMGALPLERAMHAELETSWQAWHSAPVPTLGPGLETSRQQRLQTWQACI